jgi:hypothetical protein
LSIERCEPQRTLNGLFGATRNALIECIKMSVWLSCSVMTVSEPLDAKALLIERKALGKDISGGMISQHASDMDSCQRVLFRKYFYLLGHDRSSRAAPFP